MFSKRDRRILGLFCEIKTSDKATAKVMLVQGLAFHVSFVNAHHWSVQAVR
jgi:hypothetical protein